MIRTVCVKGQIAIISKPVPIEKQQSIDNSARHLQLPGLSTEVGIVIVRILL